MENISRRRLGYFSVLLQILPPPPKQNNDTLWERRTFSLRPSIGPRYLDRKNSGWPESVGFYRIYGVRKPTDKCTGTPSIQPNRDVGWNSRSEERRVGKEGEKLWGPAQ